MSRTAVAILLGGIATFGIVPTHSAGRPVEQLDPPVRLFVFDLAGDGIKLTSAAEGVMFDLDSTGKPVRVAWTTPDSDDGFILVEVPKSGIPSGHQLLGTGLRLADGRRTAVSNVALMGVQGFPLDKDLKVIGDLNTMPDVALGPEDAVFSSLRFWRDANHNGRAEPEELRTMEDIGLLRIINTFRIERETDTHGNQLGYRGRFALSVRGVEVWRDFRNVLLAR